MIEWIKQKWLSSAAVEKILWILTVVKIIVAVFAVSQVLALDQELAAKGCSMFVKQTGGALS